MTYQRPLIIGHRGSSANYPENTVISFAKGMEQGAEMFELDVRLSKDGYPVVMHDNKLLRIAGKNGTVSQHTWKYLHSLDIGSWKSPEFSGARISLLEEVLSFIAPHELVDLEMKFTHGSDPWPLVTKVAEILKKLGLTRRVLVSSFRRQALPLLQQLIPEIMTAGLYDKNEGPLGKKELSELSQQPLRSDLKSGELPFKGRMMCLHYDLATEEFVKQVNDLGGGVLCWTVNDPQDMVRLAKYGVKGIISNDPALLRETLLNMEEPD